MIGVVDVEVQAANPQMPLYPFRAFVNSPSSVRVRNVPTEIGAWKITSVRVVVAYPDSSIKTVDCVPAGSAWVATVAGCAVSGTAENGFTVFASGVDEKGNAVSNYCLGKGNVEILKADGTLSPDAPSYYVHLFDEQPTAPNEGDMWPTSGGFVIWHDGEAHGSITVDSALSATSENPVQNKVVTAAVNARPTKSQIEEGWWSEWTVSPSAPVGKRFYFEFSSSGQWNIFLGDEGGLDPSLPPIEVITPANGEETELQFEEGSIEYTATRHRVAAPVPTRPEDIGAQPSLGYTPENAANKVTALSDPTDEQYPSALLLQNELAKKSAPYPFVTPTFAQTEDWTFSGTAAPSGYHWGMLYVDVEGDEGWRLLRVPDEGSDEPTVQDTSAVPQSSATVSFTTAGVTATRGYVATVAPFTNAQIEMGKWTVLRDGVDVTSQVSQPVWVDDAYGPGGGAWGVGVVTGESSEGYADYDEDALSIEWIGTDDEAGSSSHYTATRPPSAFEIAVGALPAGVTGKVRDCILVIDCTATGSVAPTVTWDTHFHPRTDTATDLAIVEAGKRAVFYISEYAPGEFAVGGWVETAGGSGT